MREQGNYIKDARLVFEEGFQRDFIEKSKNKLSKSWKDMASEIGISEYTLRAEWRNEKSTLPFSYAKKLCKMASMDFETVLDNVVEILPLNWGQCLGNSERIGEITKEVNFPDLTNPRLAELVGAFLGDGYLFEYGLEFCGEFELEQNYLTSYLKNLISDLFGIGVRTRVQKNVLRLRAYSKELTNWLGRSFGFEPGKKVESRSTIPSTFFEEDILLKNCLRGCIDTDGGIYKYYDHLVIAFFNENEFLLSDVIEGLRELGLSSSLVKENEVWVLGRKEADRYLSEIGTSNLKNVFRIEEWKEKGEFPKIQKIKNEMNKESNKELPYTT